MADSRPDGLTLDNWQDGPWNRWAYQHVSHLIPTARISRGLRPIAPLESATRPEHPALRTERRRHDHAALRC